MVSDNHTAPNILAAEAEVSPGLLHHRNCLPDYIENLEQKKAGIDQRD